MQMQKYNSIFILVENEMHISMCRTCTNRQTDSIIVQEITPTASVVTLWSNKYTSLDQVTKCTTDMMNN